MQQNIKPMVSILLPTYNRSNLLDRCVNSVLLQTYSNWELIISDDGSKDDTPLIAKKISDKDIRIKFHRNSTNKGLPINRNIAISKAKSNLIFFIEDDLVLDKYCLEKLIDTYIELNSKTKIGAIAPRLIDYGKKTNVLFSDGFNYIGHNMRKKFNSPCMFDRRTGIFFRNFSIDTGKVKEIVDVHACSLYQKKVLLEIGGYSSVYTGGAFSEETDTNLRIKKRGYKFFFQPKAIVHHKQVGSGGCSQTSSTFSYYFHYIKNNILIRGRNFGWKAWYMIPCFIFFIFFSAFKYSLFKSNNKMNKNLDNNSPKIEKDIEITEGKKIY